MSFMGGKPPEVPNTGTFDGPESGFMENFQDTWKDENLRMAGNGLEVDLQEQWLANAERYKSATGEDLTGVEPFRYMYMDGAKISEGVEFEPSDNGGTRDAWEQFQEAQKKLATYRANNPHDTSVSTFEDMWGTTKTRAKDYRDTMQQTSDRASFSGDVGSFSASMISAFNPETNLFNFATLGLGGFGKGAASRILTEGGAGATIEAINQFTGVAERQDLMGVPTTTGEKVGQVAFAGVGAAGFRGVFEGAPKLRDVVEARVAPSRLAGRELGQAAEQIKLNNTAYDDAVLALDPSKLSIGSSGRAAIVTEQSNILFARSNPFGDSDIADDLHTARMSEAIEPVTLRLRAELTGTTAVIPEIKGVEFQPTSRTFSQGAAKVNDFAAKSPEVLDAARTRDPVLINEYSRLVENVDSKTRWLNDLAAKNDTDLKANEIARLDDEISVRETKNAGKKPRSPSVLKRNEEIRDLKKQKAITEKEFSAIVRQDVDALNAERIAIDKEVSVRVRKIENASGRQRKVLEKEVERLRSRDAEIRDITVRNDTPDMARLRREISEDNVKLDAMSKDVDGVLKRSANELNISRSKPIKPIRVDDLVSSIIERNEIDPARPAKSLIDMLDPHKVNGKNLKDSADDMVRSLEASDPKIAQVHADDVSGVLSRLDEETNTVNLGRDFEDVDLDTKIFTSDAEGGQPMTLREFLVDENKADDDMLEAMTFCVLGGK